MTLHGQRSRDRVQVVYSRSEERASAFKERWGIPESTTDMAAAVNHPETDVVIVGLVVACLIALIVLVVLVVLVIVIPRD